MSCRAASAASEAIPLTRLSVQIDATSTSPMRLLVVGPTENCPPPVKELMAIHGIEPIHAASCQEACEPALLSQADAVLICDPEVARAANVKQHDYQLLADALLSHRLTGVVLSPGASGVVPGGDSAFVAVFEDASPEELWGRINTIKHYRPLLDEMRQKVETMQRLGKKLNQQFVDLDQELRLASRLQRDFLPKILPELSDLRFTTMYRPATWVSGDVYDVRRLDESHVCVYLADAVGHGVAAGLLTMFIKQAVTGKRVTGDSYLIVPPEEVLAQLNAELVSQELPHCQFVTACYATINVETHKLTFARGGHPYPIHVNSDGQCTEVRTVGGLLGVFDGDSFTSTSLVLRPGEKLVIYSDGLEDLIIARRERNQGEVHFTPEFLASASRPGEACRDALAACLDDTEGSLAPLDDQTCVIVERLPD